MNYATQWHNNPMRSVFKTRHFHRWMRKTEPTDAALCQAVEEVAAGLIDAELGGGVVKKRVGLAGRRALAETFTPHVQGYGVALLETFDVLIDKDCQAREGSPQDHRPPLADELARLPRGEL